MTSWIFRYKPIIKHYPPLVLAHFPATWHFPTFLFLLQLAHQQGQNCQDLPQPANNPCSPEPYSSLRSRRHTASRCNPRIDVLLIIRPRGVMVFVRHEEYQACKVGGKLGCYAARRACVCSLLSCVEALAGSRRETSIDLLSLPTSRSTGDSE